ncbi:PAS domain S-box protein [Thermodesulfobacteriota bacterium]
MTTEPDKPLQHFHNSPGCLNSIIEGSPDCIVITDNTGNIVRTNQSFAKLVGHAREDVLGKHIVEFSPRGAGIYESSTGASVVLDSEHFRQRRNMIYEKLFSEGRVSNWETYLLSRQGRLIPVENNTYLLYNDGTERIGSVGILRDITAHKQAEQQLAHYRSQLEDLVRKHTADLELKTCKLEKMSATLETLLAKRRTDKKDMELQVLANVSKLIIPLVEQLKQTQLDASQQTCIELLESSLHKLVTPLSHKLSSNYFGLSPNEIKIAGFVKAGKRTKEIAALLNLSPRTIEYYRRKIRHKMGLANQRDSLQSKLQALS